ncbi:hypothetical protein HII12_002624 [Brettanomyces bruxellensis]|uniref:DEBR0S5_06502g1_1 n=1 Tax=Dekkera bruxellensis TaxID=5007 RepID=A0A7D9H1X3_DEKBR|nr:uncharacterized protein BRETT_000284 [Brettanomyces bruxellensis]KAF6011031.1 hypothetical protein HII12_002624 [Brettanomyces bruxellensis]QOU20574.1 hypothetical protein BRETT_000284 [Brettanomyces bruxellensis]VUG19582.1 RPP1 [Brettanomyces bruxellensis]
MICDLNVVYPQDDFDVFPGARELNKLKGCLAVLEQLGYTHIALNFEPKWTSGTINKHMPGDIQKVNPINVDKDFPEFKGRLKIYSRITLKIDDPSQCQNITKFQQVFDIVAVEPQTERALQLAITNLEVDIITFNYRERLPCYLKHKTIGAATEKGIHFEIKYSDILESGTHARAQAISNIKQLIRASRSRGLLCTSGITFEERSRARAYCDVSVLLEFMGLDRNRASQAFKDWSLDVLLSGRLRIKSYKQVIAVSGDGGLIDNSLEQNDWSLKRKDAPTNIKIDARGYKKRRLVEKD